jgi:hypothetical protein
LTTKKAKVIIGAIQADSRRSPGGAVTNAGSFVLIGTTLTLKPPLPNKGPEILLAEVLSPARMRSSTRACLCHKRRSLALSLNDPPASDSALKSLP